MKPATTLTVYSRSYCHLCDDMIAALRELQGRHAFAIDIIDVDSNAALETRYGEKVPVLMTAPDGRELCHYFLDASAVTAYLTQTR